ncbi:ABC transporter ATP-binding protein [Neptunitalea chrysea]|uniref:ABC transporter ATP-binding protein n=1 Tax=Neptunitalea chrysea TaxID=1647581 RepID=A0A9W6EW63_9FLAO|nr:ATP-binding cassette domain-containing protein [Neptunitalea chrysea]GLB53856.1 ABC transporter ATP-binding protein [Neptunitalea chrysea]
MTNNLLEATNIHKKYGSHVALNNLSINIPKGCIYGLLGPNGAGKTSFIRILNQITYPDAGTVLFDGEELQPKHIANIGYLPEERGLYKSMKVGEQALYLAQLKGLSKAEAKEKLTYWFDKLEIGDWWNMKIQELSKGMAQKIQFVVTVLHTPKLLIFDEPFSGFDPINANLIKDEILKLKENGATVIFSTHRMESVEELCDEIALINKSNKILDGKLIDVKRQFRSNTYEIALDVKDKGAVYNEIMNSHFKMHEADFRTLGEELKFSIQIDADSSPNELLSFLMNRGTVAHFKELIPSVNDIFIKAVNNHNI